MNKIPLLSTLIYFVLFMAAIFLAIRLNNIWDTYQHHNKAQVIFKDIIAEVKQNQALLNTSQPKNNQLLRNIRQHLKDSVLSISKLRFAPVYLKYTAWNTSRYLQMPRHWQPDILYNVSQMYEFQQLHKEHTQALSRMVRSIAFYEHQQLRTSLDAFEANLSVLCNIDTQLQALYKTFLLVHPTQ
ncbi:hypothetical protein [Microscilla marina]|uniref:Uncharacterized protein n=1 Tax=Microscilla marina ATCC 23134 TaxID=313606 RepID=A1ZPB7_MICM2|nr:hypothetical protein [Microscilla marina]EAY27656.1 hypothetical protein M23134_03724 [Microscilla marina ATCC 23134]